MNEPPNDDQFPPPTRRRWWLAGLAWGLAFAVFFVPQHVPLEWYPLNNPGNDINYLEIKCASDADGWVTILYDITHGWNDIDQIRFPISPTEQTYTYTFPLPDGPMIGLRIDPVAKGGTLTVHHLRIINRRNEEIQDFPIESLRPILQIENLRQLEPGWAITSTTDAVGPSVHVEAFPPIVPVDMNKRNLYRCLLSTGYLAGMLVILMLAVTTAFWRPTGWMDFFAHVLLLVAIAIPFSAVGNRGLIRNSISYARFEPPQYAVPVSLQMKVQSDRPAELQVFWDTGQGENEDDSARQSYTIAPNPQFIRFPLPVEPIRSLRFDPLNRAGSIRISEPRLIRGVSGVEADLPLAAVRPRNDIASMEQTEEELTVVTIPDAGDPILEITPDAVATINEVLAQEAE